MVHTVARRVLMNKFVRPKVEPDWRSSVHACAPLADEVATIKRLE